MIEMSGLSPDIRYALRKLRRSPVFTTTVVLMLAIGIGANAAVFSVIDAVLLRALPYKDPAQLVLLQDSQDPENAGFLLKDVNELTAQTRSFADVAVYYRDSGFSNVTISDGNEPESVQGAFVSSNLFPIMGVPPAVGRTFSSLEENQRERVVVLSYKQWTSRFGASRDVIGRDLRIDGAAFRIVGVMPADFQFPERDQQFWAPITTNRFWGDPSLEKVDPSHSRYAFERWQAIARLRMGVTLAQAQSEINLLFSRMSQGDADPNRGAAVSVSPLRVVVSGNTRRGLLVLFGAVFFVLLIACSNVANLLLARSAARSREIAVRTALGAGRMHVLRQLLAESAILALLAGVAGVLFAEWGIRFLTALAPSDIPRIDQAGLDSGVLAFCACLSLLCTIAFGLTPAWALLKRAPNEALKPGERSVSSSRPQTRTRATLVVAELSIAVVLLAATGLLVRSLLALGAIDPGFEPVNVLTINASLPSSASDSRNTFYNAALERARNLPGVRSAGEVDSLFENGNVSNLGLRAIEGRDPEPKERWTPLSWVSVRGDFFQAMGTPLLRGRYFTEEDGPRSPLVAIIDESMAHRYWPNENPIGRRFKGQDARGLKDDWLTVIGVVKDTHRGGLEKNPIPHVFEPSTQAIDGDRTPYLVVRTTGDPNAVAGGLRTVVRGLSNAAIVSGVTTLEQELSEQLSPRRFQTLLLGAFSLVALGLAVLGITTLMHYSVVQRAQEMGIRVALGASSHDIMRLVLSEAMALAGYGISVGLCVALIVTRFMASLLFAIRPTDAVTFIAAPMLLAIVALLACWFPARCATKVDPMVALRYE